METNKIQLDGNNRISTHHTHLRENNTTNDKKAYHRSIVMDLPHTHDIPELGENIKFSYIVDQDTGKIRIKIYDFMTGETIQEIPSDEFLNFLKEIKKGISEEELKKTYLVPPGIFLENTI